MVNGLILKITFNSRGYVMMIDGNFKVDGSKCEHHCSPSCHPGQLGPEWRYGCLSKKHPHYDEADFCPLVECGGDSEKCEINKPE